MGEIHELDLRDLTRGSSIHEFSKVIFQFHKFMNEKTLFHEFTNIHEPRQEFWFSSNFYALKG